MKFKHSIALCIFALGLAMGRAQEAKLNMPAEQQSQPAAAGKPSFTDAQILEELGWFFGKRMGFAELGFTQADLDAVFKGMSSAALGKDSPYELEKIGPVVDEYMQKKQGAYVAKVKEKGSAESAALFEKLKENKNVVALPSGLRYEIVQPGAGAYPKATDTVKVHYTGKLVDGTVFDSSEGGQPAEFPLNGVIAGWTEGLQKINKGGKITLYVPPQLGYGDQAQSNIPPGSTLIFDVELLDINPPAPAATALPTPAK